MAQRVKRTDVAESDVYGLITESLDKLIKKTEDGNKVFAKQADLVKTVTSELPRNQKELNALMVANKKLVVVAEQKQKVDKQAIQTQKQLEKARLEEIRIQKQREVAMDKFEKQRNREIKQAQQVRKSTIDGANAYKTLTRQVNNAQARFKRLAAQYGVTDKRAVAARKTFEKLDNRLRKINDSARDGRRDVGRYGKALEGAKGSALRMFAAFGAGLSVFRILRNGIGIIQDYGQAQANLASVLGKTVAETSKLSAQQKELGASTIFTASQVAELQTEFAKLGFTQSQIMDMTEATLQLAAASGTDLATAASVAGSTLRGFGLDASDTQRVVDVMAKSFSTSSLDMEKFKVAMASVAPVAKSAGVSLERTTALLGTLTDRGIDAGTAGTGLRNIFLALTEQGLTWDEAMEKINTSADKNAQALDLFGTRGATLGVILAENGSSIDLLDEKLQNAGGAAEKMAETQLKTLSGSLALLQSAWEGQVLALDEAGGVGEKLRMTIGFLAENLDAIFTVLGRVIQSFIVWKTAMAALKLQERIRDFKKFGKGVEDVGKGLTEGQKSAKAFGNALKGIGLSLAITAVIEFARALYDVASGAARARFEIEKLAEATQKGQEVGKKLIEENNDLLQDELNLIEKRRVEENLSEEQVKKLQLAATRASKQRIRNVLAELRAENELLFARIESQKAIVAQAEDYNQFIDVTGESTENMIKEQNQLTSLNQTLEANKQVIAALSGEMKGLNQQTFDLGVAAKESNDKIKDLSRDIEDEQIQRISNAQARAEKEAQVDAQRRIEDLKDIKATGAQKIALEKEIQRNLIVTLANIQKEYDDERKAARNEAAQEELDFKIAQTQRAIDLEIEIGERTGDFNSERLNTLLDDEKKYREAQINLAWQYAVEVAETAAEVEAAEKAKTRQLIELEQELADKRREIRVSQINTEFDRELKEERLALLNSDKSRRQIEEEFTQFKVQQLQERIDAIKAAGEDTLDLEIQLAEMQKAQAEKAAKERRDIIRQTADDVLDEAIRISQERQKIFESDIEASQRLEDRLREAAENGSITADESIKEQQRLAAEAERAKQEEVRKQQLYEEIKMIYASINNFLDQGDELPEATAKSITGVTLVKQLANSISGFYKGTKGKLKDENNPLRGGKDGHLIWADGDEMIINPDKTNQLDQAGITTTDALVNNALMYQQMKGASYMSITKADKYGESSSTALVKAANDIKNAIENMPENKMEVGRVLQSHMVIKETRRKGQVKNTNKYVVRS